MKTILTLSLVSIMFFFGCDQGIDISSPGISLDQQKNKKNSTDLFNPLDSTESTLNGERKDDTINLMDFNKIEITKLIDGQFGGEISVDTTYINNEGRIITIDAKLKFPLNSFQGTSNFIMVFSDEDLSVRIYPHMTFTNEVKLDVIYEGVDLVANGFTETADTVAVDFAYFGDDGTIELISNQESKINWKKNLIKVVDAELSHFSRYGWIR